MVHRNACTKMYVCRNSKSHVYRNVIGLQQIAVLDVSQVGKLEYELLSLFTWTPTSSMYLPL